MAKLAVSMSTYGEIFSLLKRQGIEINDGQPLQIEKGTALVPPVDFRMVALRQNCLDAAARAYIAPVNSKDYNIQDDARFIQFCETIFQWAFTGEVKQTTVKYENDINTNEKPKTAVVKTKPNSGW